MTNTEQAEYWGGAEGRHWAAEQDRFDRMLDPYNEALVGAAVESAADRILDVGCGNGSSSRALARAVPDGHLVGADLSEPMLERARQTAAAEGLVNLEHLRADAQTHDFGDGAFGAATSRFGVMFFEDPVAAFANIGRALRPAGRLAFVCWRDPMENEWVAVPGAALLSHLPMPDLGDPDQPGPFTLADPERVRAVLAEAGMAEVDLEPVDRPNRLGADPDDAVTFIQQTGIGQQFVADAEPDARARALEAVREAFAAYHGPDGVVLGSAAWLVTARRPG